MAKLPSDSPRRRHVLGEQVQWIAELAARTSSPSMTAQGSTDGWRVCAKRSKPVPFWPQKTIRENFARNKKPTPFSPSSGPAQRLFQEPPAKSKFRFFVADA